jgi:hypothetical protein
MCEVRSEDMEDFAKPLVEEVSSEKRALYEQILVEMLPNFNINKSYESMIRPFSKKYSIMPSKSELVTVYLDMVRSGKIERNELFKRALTRKLRRSTCGILNITVFTHPGNMGPTWRVNITKLNENANDAQSRAVFKLEMIQQTGPYNFRNYAEYTLGIDEIFVSNYRIVEIHEKSLIFQADEPPNEKRTVFELESSMELFERMNRMNSENNESIEAILKGRISLRSCPYRCAFCPTEKVHTHTRTHTHIHAHTCALSSCRRQIKTN